MLNLVVHKASVRFENVNIRYWRST